MGPSQQGVPATLVCTQAQMGRTTVRVRSGCKNKFSAVGASTNIVEFQQKFDCMNEADDV